jgi:hypothetical protein
MRNRGGKIQRGATQETVLVKNASDPPKQTIQIPIAKLQRFGRKKKGVRVERTKNLKCRLRDTETFRGEDFQVERWAGWK